MKRPVIVFRLKITMYGNGALVLNPDTQNELKNSGLWSACVEQLRERGVVVNSDNLLEGEIKSARESGFIAL